MRRVAMLLSAVLVPAVLLLPACSVPTDPDASTSAAPTSAPVDWVTRCTGQVSYWATTVLADPDHGYDYQEMGLSAESYDALRTVLAASRGRPRDDAWMLAHSRSACRAVDATAVPQSPGDPGWP